MKKFLLFVSAAVAALPAVAQNCSELFISKYIQFGSNNKAIELYNPTANPINLAGYKVERFKSPSSGPVSQTMSDSVHLRGVVPAYGTWVLVNGQAVIDTVNPGPNQYYTYPPMQGLRDQADQFSNPYGTYGSTVGDPMYFKGNDCLKLTKNGAVVDMFGETGQTVRFWSSLPPYRGQTGQGKWLSKGYLLVRKPSVKSGNPVMVDPNVGFNILLEYDTIPQPDSTSTLQDTLDTFSLFGNHSCECNASGIAARVNATASVFPNPSAPGQALWVVTNREVAEMELVDLSGRRVYFNREPQRGMVQSLNLPNVPNGIYFLQLRGRDNWTLTRKVVVQ